MSIPQPTLDDRSYAGLLEEARTLIPSLAPKWTNHNPSDPGITLVELFAWLTEMLIYRVNRLPEANTLAYLQLLNGPDWEPSDDLEADIRATVLDLRKRHRAVTAEDYEVLAREVDPGVARARCVAKRKLDEADEEKRRVPREGYVSVVVVPDESISAAVSSDSKPGAPLPSEVLLDKVRADLEPRRLLTVRQLVVPPVYVPINARLLIASRPGVKAEDLRGQVLQKIEDYLHPLKGGSEGEGWPFGRDVYNSEIYRLLERVPGVDFVSDVALTSKIMGEELWNDNGDQIGIGLAAHHLPWAQIESDEILIGSAFLPVRVHVKATAEEGYDPAKARRAAKNAIKDKFHWPGGAPLDQKVVASEIRTALVGLDEIAATPLPIVTIQADPARLSGSGTEVTVHFEPKEQADLTVTVEI